VSAIWVVVFIFILLCFCFGLFLLFLYLLCFWSCFFCNVDFFFYVYDRSSYTHSCFPSNDYGWMHEERSRRLLPLFVIMFQTSKIEISDKTFQFHSNDIVFIIINNFHYILLPIFLVYFFWVLIKISILISKYEGNSVKNPFTGVSWIILKELYN